MGPNVINRLVVPCPRIQLLLSLLSLYHSDTDHVLVLGIGQENHNRLSEELNRLIIDCTIGFLLAMSNNIQQVP